MINPLQLFDSIKENNPKIDSLRKAQKETLEFYTNEFLEKSRVGVKLPTGSGKSLIALLLLEAHRREGKVVAILSANKALARDIKKKCDEFQIPSETIFGVKKGDSAYNIRRTRNLLKYKKKRIIGIFNYHSFLYGMEYKEEIFPPDVLVIDDASDFTIVRNNFFSITINRNRHEAVYKKILESLEDKSKLYPNLQNFQNKSARQSDVELIYFNHYEKIFKVIEDNLAELFKETTFRYSYERNMGMSSSLLVFISQYDIELRPLLIPEESLKMGNIKQIVFMSATLPNEELLNKIFGIKKNAVTIIDENIISKEAFEEITTLGKRLIFPLDQTDLRPGLGEKCKSIIFDLVKIHGKVLALANSTYDSECLEKYLKSKNIETHIFNEMTYEHFANTMQKGVLICPNRYFGLDFPGDTCKVEVIIRLPSIWDNIDAFQERVLNNSNYVNQTIGYRLTQSLGRCNRLLEDEALYYILDSRILARVTGIPQYLTFLPKNIYAELITGYSLSEGGIIKNAINYGANSFFGKKNQLFEEILTEEIEMWDYDEENMFTSKYDLEIEGWEKSLSKSYQTAGNLFDYVATNYREKAPDVKEQNLELLAAFNYYLSAMNHYNAFAHFNDVEEKKKSLKSIRNAIELGGSTSWFNSLRALYNELSDNEKLDFNVDRIAVRQTKEKISNNFSDFINANTSKDRNWKETFRQLQRDLNEGSHGQALNALATFFEIIEFHSKTGVNQKSEPDLLASSQKYTLSVELKTKQKGELESVESVTEAMGDGKVVERTSINKTYILLITQKEEFSSKAIEVAKSQVKIIPTSVFSNLMEMVYEQIERWDSLEPAAKSIFINSLISPYELEQSFTPSTEPILRKFTF